MTEQWDDRNPNDHEIDELLQSAPPQEKLDPARRSEIWQQLECSLAAPKPQMIQIGKSHGSRPAFAAAAAALLVFVAGISYYLARPAKPIAPIRPIARVEQITGTVLRRSSISSSSQENQVVEGQDLKAMDILRTGLDGSAHVRFADGSTILLCPGTDALIFGRSDKHDAISLLCGELRADITHDPNHPFSILTPEARLRVLGTQFSCRVLPPIEFKENESMKTLRDTLRKAMLIVSVITGSVAIDPLDTAAAGQVVQAGQRTVVSANQTSTDKLTNIDYSRDINKDRPSSPKPEAYVFEPVRSSLMSSLWAVDVQTNQTRHVADFVGFPRMQSQFAGLALVNVGSVLFAHFGNEPISGSGRPIINNRLMLVDLATGRKIPMLPLENYDPLYLDLSPDCRKLAFVGKRRAEKDQPTTEFGLFVMDLETFKIDLLLKGNLKTCPHWSPDSRWLAISNGEGYVTNHGIVLIDTATREVVNTGLQGVGIVFSPDGKSMVYSAEFKQGRGWSAGIPSSGNLFISDFPNGKPHRLTNLPAGGAIFPIYSPDGASIAYWESAGQTSQLHILDVATGNDRTITSGDPFGSTRWIGRDKIFLSYRERKLEAQKTVYEERVKLVDLSGAEPKIREIAPELPYENAQAAMKNTQADQLYNVFGVYAEAIKAQDVHDFARAQNKFGEARDLLQKITDAAPNPTTGAGFQDLNPYLEKFAAEAKIDPSRRSIQIVSDNLKYYMPTMIRMYYDKYHTLPTANKSDDPNAPTFADVALGKHGLQFTINHIHSYDLERYRPLFLIPGDDPAKVATSYKILMRDPAAGVFVLETPPLADGKKLQATYRLATKNKFTNIDVDIKSID